DAQAAFGALDQQTRWSIESTWKYHQRALKLIEDQYPPSVQAREKARFVDAETAVAFLAAVETRDHLLAGLRPRLSSLQPSDCVEGPRKRFGYSGLRATWEGLKARAYHDFETVREGAAAFGRLEP